MQNSNQQTMSCKRLKFDIKTCLTLNFLSKKQNMILIMSWLSSFTKYSRQRNIRCIYIYIYVDCDKHLATKFIKTKIPISIDKQDKSFYL